MQSETYTRLQEIFATFNEAVMIFYADLSELLPPAEKTKTLEGLSMTLKYTNSVFRQAAEMLYKN
jgi:hypothetical protein